MIIDEICDIAFLQRFSIPMFFFSFVYSGANRRFGSKRYVEASLVIAADSN